MQEEQPKMTFSVSKVDGVPVLSFRCSVCSRGGTANYIPGESEDDVAKRIYTEHNCSGHYEGP